MGRPELPVDYTVTARGELAEVLRTMRAGARLTYDELAVRTGVSAATLKRAASGRHVPTWETVTAITEACDGDVDPLVKALWQRARIVERGRLKDLRAPASPELINTPAGLSEALEYFYERAGALSLRRLQERAGGAHLLPVSTAARIVNRQALPASRQQCEAFLTACGILGRLRSRWVDAFERTIRPGRHLSDTETALRIEEMNRRFDESWHWQDSVRRRNRHRLVNRGVRAPWTGVQEQALFELPDDGDLRAA